MPTTDSSEPVTHAVVGGLQPAERLLQPAEGRPARGAVGSRRHARRLARVPLAVVARHDGGGRRRRLRGAVRRQLRSAQRRDHAAVDGRARDARRRANHRRREGSALSHLVERRASTPLPGAAEWVRRLHDSGWRQAIASSAPRLNVEVMARVLGPGAVSGCARRRRGRAPRQTGSGRLSDRGGRASACRRTDASWSKTPRPASKPRAAPACRASASETAERMRRRSARRHSISFRPTCSID